MNKLISFLSFGFSLQVMAATPPMLTLEQFLGQVKSLNQGYQASAQATQGAAERAQEGGLVFAPTLQVNGQLSDDKSPKVSVAFQGIQTRFDTYSLGINKVWDFGLTSKLAYTLNYTDVIGASAALLTLPRFHESRPSLDLSLPLLRNGLGSEFRAQAGLSDAQAEAVRAAESFRAKATLAQAEVAYWRLAVARDIVRVERETLDRAQKMVEWNARRVRLHLGDESDLRQAEALLSLRKIELQAAIDEERTASRNFNTARGMDSDSVGETVLSFDHATRQRPSLPERKGLREDTQALIAQARAAELQARLGLERNRPSLDVYSSLTLNGRSADLSRAVSDSLQINQHTAAVGVRFTVPLDLGLVSDNRSGYRKEVIGADLRATRAAFEEESTWQDTVRRYQETIARLELVRQLEEAQRRKFVYERDRQTRGKSTVFLVLQFEQDYNAAQVNRLRAEADFLSLVATMKTWSQ